MALYYVTMDEHTSSNNLNKRPYSRGVSKLFDLYYTKMNNDIMTMDCDGGGQGHCSPLYLYKCFTVVLVP